MARNNLANGLVISETTLDRQCEDCILGRQMHCPFDGETEKNLKPLGLVAFDLWGPSRVQSAGGKVYLMIIVNGEMSCKYGLYLPDKFDPTTISAFDTFRIKAETVARRKIH
jgi:hypothetical protein